MLPCIHEGKKEEENFLFVFEGKHFSSYLFVGFVFLFEKKSGESF